MFMENTRRILFLNHAAQRCGVADYGRRLFAILKKSDLDITYCDTTPDFPGYDIALYNYHYATMPEVTFSEKGIRHVALFHEAHLDYDPDQVINVRELPRPLFEGFKNTVIFVACPVIGSFGFGFPEKNFPGICQMVKDQYPKAMIRLNIPFAEFGDKEGILAKQEADKCRAILEGTNIHLSVNHDFLSAPELLRWLSMNDLNLFLYTYSKGRGISSATDYALSVRKPIGISSSEMFRHLPREICVDNTALKDLSIEPLKKVWEQNSNARLVETLKNLLW